MNAAWLKRVEALPWASVGTAAAVVVLGVSQVFFSLILRNADYFPKEPWFHLAVLAWVGVIPFAGVLAADLGLIRWTGRERAFAVWRAALYTIAFASLARQAQVYYPSPFQWGLERIPPRPVVAFALALVFLLCLRSRVLIHRYAASLGLLAAMLVGSYAYGTGLLGSAWRGSSVTPKASAIAWKGDPVFLIIFDELSSDVLLKGDRIDPELFPNLAALAADSAWFPNARSNHIFTKDSIPCMLSGRLDPADRDPKIFDYLPKECGVIARDWTQTTYGWMRRNARPGQVFLLWSRKEETLRDALGVPAVLADLFQQTPFSRSPFGVMPALRILPALNRADHPADRSVKEEVDAFLSGVNAGAAGTLTYWHAPLPHYPYLFNPDGSTHEPGSAQIPQLASGRAPAGFDPAPVLENYRKQVRYTDLVVGRVVDTLKREGLYERATLVVTSDHGLRTWGAVEPKNWPQDIAGNATGVPLMIRGPHVKPGVYAVDHQHVDFTPTLLDALKIPYDPKAFEGVSGFASSRPPRPPVMYYEGKMYAYDAARDVWSLRAPR